MCVYVYVYIYVSHYKTRCNKDPRVPPNSRCSRRPPGSFLAKATPAWMKSLSRDSWVPGLLGFRALNPKP